MQNKIVENPKFIGCLNCSSKPTTKLNKYNPIYVYGFIILNIKGKRSKFIPDDEGIRPVEIYKKYKGLLLKSDCSTLEVSGMLHGEVYEFNKEDREWYLIEQNQGLA